MRWLPTGGVTWCVRGVPGSAHLLHIMRPPAFLLYSFLDLTFVPSAISLNAAMLYQALRGGGGRFGSVLTQVSAVEDGRGDIPCVVLTKH